MVNRGIAVALLAIAALFGPSEARAQCTGQPPGNTVCAAPNGVAGLPRFRALVAGDLPAGSGVSSVFTRTGAVVAATNDYDFSQIGPSRLALGQMPSAAANSLYGNLLLNTPVVVPVPSCTGGTNALTWTSGTGFGCNTISATATSVTVGTTTVGSGTAGRVLFNNGTLGEYLISGTGSVAMTNSPAFVTPSLGAATATSVNGIVTTGAGTVAYGAGGIVAYKIQSGIAALGTSVIGSAACAATVTVAATGVATTDVISVSFNSDPTGVVGYQPLAAGMLTIIPFPTLNNVNFRVCNTTAASITPGAITLNWRVDR